MPLELDFEFEDQLLSQTELDVWLYDPPVAKWTALCGHCCQSSEMGVSLQFSSRIKSPRVNLKVIAASQMTEVIEPYSKLQAASIGISIGSDSDG